MIRIDEIHVYCGLCDKKAVFSLHAWRNMEGIGGFILPDNIITWSLCIKHLKELKKTIDRKLKGVK